MNVRRNWKISLLEDMEDVEDIGDIADMWGIEDIQDKFELHVGSRQLYNFQNTSSVYRTIQRRSVCLKNSISDRLTTNEIHESETGSSRLMVG